MVIGRLLRVHLRMKSSFAVEGTAIEHSVKKRAHPSKKRTVWLGRADPVLLQSLPWEKSKENTTI